MDNAVLEPIIEEFEIEEILEALCCACSADDDNPF